MLPQPVSNWTTKARNSLKQGVVRVARVERKFIMPDGTVKDENDMSTAEIKAVAQKIMDELVAPLAYDLVIKDIQREMDAAN